MAPRRRILIVCEGAETEPQYFGAFTRWKRNPTVEVQVHGGAGDPVTLVNRAKEIQAAAQQRATSERDENLAYDEVWCCFDVDQFGARVPRAREEARMSGLQLAMSNPCFELWLILHLRENPGAQHHHAMQDIWSALQPTLAEKHIDFEALKGGYLPAVARAARLHKQALDDDEPARNPVTEVYLLTESIDADGRERRELEERKNRERHSRAKAHAAEQQAFEQARREEDER